MTSNDIAASRSDKLWNGTVHYQCGCQLCPAHAYPERAPHPDLQALYMAATQANGDLAHALNEAYKNLTPPTRILLKKEMGPDTTTTAAHVTTEPVVASSSAKTAQSVVTFTSENLARSITGKSGSFALFHLLLFPLELLALLVMDDLFGRYGDVLDRNHWAQYITRIHLVVYCIAIGRSHWCVYLVVTLFIIHEPVLGCSVRRRSEWSVRPCSPFSR